MQIIALLDTPINPKSPVLRTRVDKCMRHESLGRLKILSISPMPEDHLMLVQILDVVLWQISGVTTCREAIEHLRTEAFSAVLCESALEDGTWKDILECSAECADRPPLIVTSRLADEHLWSEVLNLGGFDVLAKPFSTRDVRHVLDSVSLRSDQSDRLPRSVGAG
jgi:DNA-binding response OmpR family regulator